MATPPQQLVNDLLASNQDNGQFVLKQAEVPHQFTVQIKVYLHHINDKHIGDEFMLRMIGTLTVQESGRLGYQAIVNSFGTTSKTTLADILLTLPQETARELNKYLPADQKIQIATYVPHFTY